MNAHSLVIRTGEVAAALAVLSAVPAHAHGVTAGTIISNTASASYSQNGATLTVKSNTVDLTVQEVLDVTVAARDTSEASVSAGASGAVRAFTVTNVGNGPEAFDLAATGNVSGNGFNPDVTQIAIDSNNDGTYEPGTDQAIAAGGATPSLDPDAAVTVFVISTIPAGAADGTHGSVQLSATAATGSGTPGTVYAGKGSGGGDAIVGATHADAKAAGGFVVSSASAAITKSATVADPFGGSSVVPGATVTYRLSTAVTGSATLPDLHVTDTIPTGTTYQAGSLTLDGAALTDAADGDAGTGSSTGIDVTLGNASAGPARIVEFKVKIN